ncbi:MAG TPA: efflux RND transporter periplasmic adaptor subunit [Planctomycetota bacterium]|jgi:multidrug efflux pump subunit AcrA (membrane-fusion protein)|nr:efflux RND transporter periplasmic adaptor subunit [Planctomycetota bacterium]
MKRRVWFAVGGLVAAALGAGTWIVLFHRTWLEPAHHEENELDVETEVAVRVAKVTRATLRRIVEAYGTVVPEPANEGKPAASARLASPVTGILAECACAEGQRVKKGDVLFQLDDRLARAEEEKAEAVVDSAKAALARLKATPRPEQVAVAEAAAEKARRGAELAQRTYDRQTSLLEQELTSERRLQETELQLISARNEQTTSEKQLALLKSSPPKEEIAEAEAKGAEAEKALAAARSQRSLLRIQAPLSGTLVHVWANPGESVDATSALAEIVDLDRLVVQAALPSPELGALALGQSAEIETGSNHDSNRGEPVKGAVGFIGLDVDPKSDSVQVRILVRSNGRLRPGQYVRVRIVADEHAGRLAVPKESVVLDPEGVSVVSIVDGARAARKRVEVGIRDGDLVEIEGDGIREGATVVTAGAYGLPKETRVRVIAR